MSTKRTETHIPKDKLALYEKLVETNPDIERKGATVPYTSLNGNMFTFLHQTGVCALRLGQKEREEFIKKYKTSLMESHGVIMKEYVAVPDKLLKNTRELMKYFDQSYEYAKSLQPKATTKPKKKAAKK